MSRIRSSIWCLGLGVAMLGCSREAGPPAAMPGPATTHATGTWQNLSGIGDLGAADFGQLKTATFQVRNDASVARRLQLLDKSCACAIVELPEDEVAPGQSAVVRIGWRPEVKRTADTHSGTSRVWAMVGGSDATGGLKLEAVGRLQPSVNIHLPAGELDFGMVEAADLRTSRHEAALEITTADTQWRDMALSVTTSHPGLAIVGIEKLAEGRLQEYRAVAGYRVTVRAGAGLPVGPFRERILLQCPMYVNGLEVPISGQVVGGAVSVEPAELNLAAARMSITSGYRAPVLRVYLRYEPNRTLTIKAVQPDFLVVDTKAVGENQWELQVRLPAGSTNLPQQLGPQRWQEVQTFGFTDGFILCETDHPLVPALRIPMIGGRLGK